MQAQDDNLEEPVHSMFGFAHTAAGACKQSFSHRTSELDGANPLAGRTVSGYIA